MPEFTLEPDQWYATVSCGIAENSPSLATGRHLPLRVSQLLPLNSGQDIFDLYCFHPIDNEKTVERVYRLKTLNRGKRSLLAKFVEDDERILYITDIDNVWIRTHFPQLLSSEARVHTTLEHAYQVDTDRLLESLINTGRDTDQSLEDVRHWSSDRFWGDAYELLQKLDHRRLISLDLELIRSSLFSGDSIAYRLMDAMWTVKERESGDCFKGAPRLLLLTLARLEAFSQLPTSDRDS